MSVPGKGAHPGSIKTVLALYQSHAANKPVPNAATAKPMLIQVNAVEMVACVNIPTIYARRDLVPTPHALATGVIGGKHP